MSRIVVMPRMPQAHTVREVLDFVPRLLEWFRLNPKRKICKVTWIDGSSIDLRPDNYREKMIRLLKKAGYNTAFLEEGGDQ